MPRKEENNIRSKNIQISKCSRRKTIFIFLRYAIFFQGSYVSSVQMTGLRGIKLNCKIRVKMWHGACVLYRIDRVIYVRNLFYEIKLGPFRYRAFSVIYTAMHFHEFSTAFLYKLFTFYFSVIYLFRCNYFADKKEKIERYIWD